MKLHKEMRSLDFYSELPFGYEHTFRYLDRISGGTFKGNLIEVGPLLGRFIKSLYGVKDIAVFGVEKAPFMAPMETREEIWTASRILPDTPIEEISIRAPASKGRSDALIASGVFSDGQTRNKVAMLRGMNFVLKKGTPVIIRVGVDKKSTLPTPVEIRESGFAIINQFTVDEEASIILHLRKMKEVFK